ncbi:helix-turn-helix domain-containing protein [Atopobium sp. oral taxon 416]
MRYSNGNQTEAAKKLGISRTTLWRILKKHEGKTS